MSSPGIAEWVIIFIVVGFLIFLIVLLIRWARKITARKSTLKISIADELLKLHSLKDKGIITQEEFETKKNQLLS